MAVNRFREYIAYTSNSTSSPQDMFTELQDIPYSQIWTFQNKWMSIIKKDVGTMTDSRPAFIKYKEIGTKTEPGLTCANNKIWKSETLNLSMNESNYHGHTRYDRMRAIIDTLEEKTPVLTVVHFSADWAEQCKQVTEVLEELLKLPEIQKSGCKIAVCDAEKLSEISLKFKIDSVPTVILYKNGIQVDRVDGADAAQIYSKVKAHSVNKISAGDLTPHNLEDRLKALINRHKVMIFMKGNREQPRCGFSKTLIQIMNDTGVPYDTFDILTDEEVRQGLKVYSDWPTYPQLYVKGELVGGLDIIKELLENGELLPTLNP